MYGPLRCSHTLRCLHRDCITGLWLWPAAKLSLLAMCQAGNNVAAIFHSFEYQQMSGFIVDKGCCNDVGSVGLNAKRLEDVHQNHHWVVIHKVVCIMKNMFPAVGRRHG